MAKLIDHTDKLRADLKKFNETVCIAFGEAAANAGPEVAKQAMDSFYSSYGPYIYKRTDNLHDHSYKRYYKNNGRKVWGGFVITSDSMAEYKYGKWDKETVVAHTWMGGAHGKTHTFPPISIAEMQLGSMADGFLDEAVKAGMSQSYETLRF